MRSPANKDKRRRPMGTVLLVASSRLREDLIAGLVRRIAARFDGADDPAEVLKACIGAALEHDLSEPEFQWLISGVEARLGLWLTPMARSA